MRNILEQFIKSKDFLENNLQTKFQERTNIYLKLSKFYMNHI